ncbi:uncharacterized protein At4g26485-like isoform X2 [Trifolium pratense]|uniref:Uncharacterized protein n=1 Tax=Trifolium pratense TaxID=57577 RepID=A0ACB0KQJ5_TRIPR|nr:uncharacterized protein At4g26485-like isoform X2 [Trifolium pratense]CAJ2658143.1 unnamed protein product [Trifolium pratense]
MAPIQQVEEEHDEEQEQEQETSLNTEKWNKHYSSKHKILFVGEEKIEKKYSNGISNARELEERGCIVLYDVDVKVMSQHFFLKTQRFDRIVYNFPHVGFLYPENSYCQIQLNKKLLKGFMTNAKALIKKDGGGEIHVTHKEGDPYNKWDLVRKAEKRGLFLHQSVPFFKDDYPGYDNKRAHGKLSDLSFPVGEASTYKFKLQTSLSNSL